MPLFRSMHTRLKSATVLGVIVWMAVSIFIILYADAALPGVMNLECVNINTQNRVDVAIDYEVFQGHRGRRLLKWSVRPLPTRSVQLSLLEVHGDSLHEALEMWGFHGARNQGGRVMESAGWKSGIVYFAEYCAPLVWIVSLVWVITCVVRLLRNKSRNDAIAYHICPRCGYDCRGLERCPECNGYQWVHSYS